MQLIISLKNWFGIGASTFYAVCHRQACLQPLISRYDCFCLKKAEQGAAGRERALEAKGCDVSLNCDREEISYQPLNFKVYVSQVQVGFT